MDIIADDFDASWTPDPKAPGTSVPSPYEAPVGSGYDLSGHGPDGRCPLCNNSKAKEIDAALMTGDFRALRGWGFTRAEIDRHLALHIGPIYARELSPLLEAIGIGTEAITDEFAPRVAERMDRVSQIRKAAGSPATPMAPVTKAIGMLAYGMDGGRQVGPLRPWTRTRAALEASMREAEAINLFDEMMDIRQKARDIYGMVVGERQDDGSFYGGYATGRKIQDEETGKVRTDYGDPRLLAIALKAVDSLAGVVKTMGTMSLIAKKLGEGTDDRPLDPGLKAIIDDIGKRSQGLVRQAVPAPGAAEAMALEDADLAHDVAEMAAERTVEHLDAE